MTAYLCAGNPPMVPPCGAEITTEAAAERHAKDEQHTVISATSSAVLDRYLAREEVS